MLKSLKLSIFIVFLLKVSQQYLHTICLIIQMVYLIDKSELSNIIPLQLLFSVVVNEYID